MVKKHFCDRCKKEIESPFEDEFEEVFNSVSSDFGVKPPVENPHLCKKCIKGYKKIINETNKKIKDYLKG